VESQRAPGAPAACLPVSRVTARAAESRVCTTSS
jgi:hypothetical protein